MEKKIKIYKTIHKEEFEINVGDNGFYVEVLIGEDDSGEWSVYKINIHNTLGLYSKVYFKNLKKAFPLIEKAAEKALKKVKKEQGIE